MWLELVLVPLEVLFGLYFDGKALGAADSLGNPDSYSSAFPIPNLFWFVTVLFSLVFYSPFALLPTLLLLLLVDLNLQLPPLWDLILLRLLLLLIPKNPDIQLSRFHHPITTPNPKPRLKIQTNPEIIIIIILCNFCLFFLLSHLSLSLHTLKRTRINALRWWVSLCRHKNLPKQEAKTNNSNNKEKANKYRKKNQESHFSSTLKIILTGTTGNKKKWKILKH